MKRRSLLAALGLMPVAAAVAKFPVMEAVAAPADDATASAAFRMVANAGGSARIGLCVAAEQMGEPVFSGMYLDVKDSGPTRIVINSDMLALPDNFPAVAITGQ